MPAERITIPEDLLQLKPSNTLKSVSMSKLARTGTAVLREITATAQAVAVKVQGHASMVTVSQRQYDEMVELIRQLREEKSDDGFTQALSRRFDSLVAQMNQPGAAQATNAALFGDPASLAKTYQPGATESKE
jgi:predicted transcriptional regulator